MMITLKLVLLALVFLCVENASYSNTLALKAGYMSAVAYENASVIASWQCSPCKKYPITSPTVFSNSTGNIQGFVGYSSVDNAIFVSFRGSQDIKNWILNLETTMTGYSLCSGCQVHKGFYSGFQMVRSQVMTQVQALKAKYPTATILVTGHSLGGALAVLAAVELQNSYGSVADVYTFGQPRVGNIPFAAYYTTHLANTFRVIHYGDIVPHLPPAGFGFYHSSHEIWYD